MADIATRRVAWVDEFQLRKTPQRENKKMCEKEEQEMTPQQHHKRVKDRRNIQGNIQNRYDGFWVPIGTNF